MVTWVFSETWTDDSLFISTRKSDEQLELLEAITKDKALNQSLTVNVKTELTNTSGGART